VGCGIGLWRQAIERHFPGAHYQGVEYSEYLCQRYGWQQGSVVDYRGEQQPFDLVICQGVLPYPEPGRPEPGAAQPGAAAAACSARGRDADYERDIIDEDLTDPRLFRHRAALRWRGLSEGFIELGGGVWLSRRAELPLFELECLGR
jgi:hypothetical protein